MSDVMGAVLSQYPGVSALLGIPEVASLIIGASNPDQPWSQEAFETALHGTHWWQTTPESARTAFTLASTDPASYAQAVGQQWSSLQDWAAKQGVLMTGAEMDYIAATWQQQGRDINDPGAQNELNVWLQAHPDRILTGGGVAAARSRIDALSRSLWFVDPQDDNLNKWSIDVATGRKTEADARAEMQAYVSAFYPHLAQRFAAGETMADIVNPYREMVAKELELGSVEEVDMMNSTQWRWLTGIDNGDGTQRLPTSQEVMRKAREDPRWWRTSNGRRTDAGLARTLLEAFGKAAF